MLCLAMMSSACAAATGAVIMRPCQRDAHSSHAHHLTPTTSQPTAVPPLCLPPQPPLLLRAACPPKATVHPTLPSSLPRRLHDGRIRLTNLSDGFIEDPAAAFPPGLRLEARVLSADPATGRLELTMRYRRAEVGAGQPAVACTYAQCLRQAGREGGRGAIRMARSGVGRGVSGGVRGRLVHGLATAAIRRPAGLPSAGRRHMPHVHLCVLCAPHAACAFACVVWSRSGSKASAPGSTVQSLADLKEGQLVSGRVRRVEKYGLFVEVRGGPAGRHGGMMVVVVWKGGRASGTVAREEGESRARRTHRGSGSSRGRGQHDGKRAWHDSRQDPGLGGERASLLAGAPRAVSAPERQRPGMGLCMCAYRPCGALCASGPAPLGRAQLPLFPVLKAGHEPRSPQPPAPQTRSYTHTQACIAAGVDVHKWQCGMPDLTRPTKLIFAPSG